MSGTTRLLALKDGIEALFPLPDEIAFDSSYQWERFEAGGLGFAIEAVMEGNITGEQALNVGQRQLASTATGITSQAQAAGMMKSATNPKEAVIFRGVTQREFGLSFNLASKDKTQMRSYLLMLNQLYRVCAPKFADGDTFLEFPSLFKLSIEDSGSKIIKDREVAVKSINTVLNPDGPFNTFVDGTPIHIRVSISFIETTIPNADSDAQIFGL
jgi:hypothetical protein